MEQTHFQLCQDSVTMIAVTQEAQTEDRALDGSPEPRRMLDERGVRAIIPVGHTTLWRMVKKGQFPKATFVSPNRCFWFEDVVLAWQNEIEGQGRAALRA
jgi:prophage regulatory protein